MAIQGPVTSSIHSMQSVTPVCKWCKHGYVWLSLPLQNSTTDITIYGDTSLNPGPHGIHLNKNELRRHLHDQHSQQRSTAIYYSRKELLKIRCLTCRLYHLSLDHCFYLKLAGLFSFHGAREAQNRIGCSLKIPVLEGAGHQFAYYR